MYNLIIYDPNVVCPTKIAFYNNNNYGFGAP
jgi:hypothetical protein